ANEARHYGVFDRAEKTDPFHLFRGRDLHNRVLPKRKPGRHAHCSRGGKGDVQHHFICGVAQNLTATDLPCRCSQWGEFQDLLTSAGTPGRSVTWEGHIRLRVDDHSSLRRPEHRGEAVIFHDGISFERVIPAVVTRI